MNLMEGKPCGIIDSHAHLLKEFYQDDQDAVIERSFASHVKQIINPGVDIDSIEELIALAKTYEQIYIGVGLHPHDAKKWSDSAEAALRAAAKDSKVVAIGECGLDFYYNNSSREDQIFAFSKQIDIAEDLEKPIIIHCRDAWQELIKLLKEKRPKIKGVFHCFTGSPAILKLVEDLDFYISFSGIVTFNNAQEIQAAAKLVNKNRLLAETDCPFLAPQKVRGKRNEPSYVWLVAEKLAELRNCSVEDIAETCVRNAQELFKLPII
jgi:TatD DNase family protein